ncbi:MAG: type IV pilus twitching motility protein PilT [Saccharofermentanales bacterium]|jgi:twitching motility protein PilT
MSSSDVLKTASLSLDEKCREYILAILTEAAEQNASDILITVGVPPTFRINGELHPVEGRDRLTPADTKEIALAFLTRAGRPQSELNPGGEHDFSLSVPQIGRFRVNIFTQRGSAAVSIRRIYTFLPDPEELAIPDTVMELSRLRQGLVLVTGPTGCGKTTTLAALIDRINNERSCHILTLEDPIEYLHQHRKSIVNQREIGTDSDSYRIALRAALRQTPDVILIGEMRDLETISIALTAAETGHLVLSTLHTIGAAKTIDRIIDVFPPSQQQQIRIQLSTVLQAVVSQQLIASESRGQLAAFEIMKMNSAIRNMIRESKTPQIDGVIQMNTANGMSTMDHSILRLYRQQLISRDKALHCATNVEAMTRSLDADIKKDGN